MNDKVYTHAWVHISRLQNENTSRELEATSESTRDRERFPRRERDFWGGKWKGTREGGGSDEKEEENR
jgi:hypothetical protein